MEKKKLMSLPGHCKVESPRFSDLVKMCRDPSVNTDAVVRDINNVILVCLHMLLNAYALPGATLKLPSRWDNSSDIV